MQQIPQTQEREAAGPYRRVEPSWMRHNRTPGDPDDDFLVPPDPSIGPVTSASTNRTKTGWHAATRTQRNQRIALAVVGGIFGGMLGAAVGGGIHEVLRGIGLWFLTPYDWVFYTLGGIGGAIASGVALYGLSLALRRPLATWVAKNGLQSYRRGLFLGPKLEILRFDDAAELKVSRIRQFVNGAYTGTQYDYQWRDRTGKIAFRINGAFRDDGVIEAQDPVTFAFAAEAAWSAHRITWFDRMIKQEGIARFQCGKDWIGVGKGFLEIGAGGQSERIERADMENIYFQQGVLVIKKKGAKEGLFRSDGVFRFPVAALTDFQVFLVVLQEQTGIKFK